MPCAPKAKAKKPQGRSLVALDWARLSGDWREEGKGQALGPRPGEASEQRRQRVQVHHKWRCQVSPYWSLCSNNRLRSRSRKVAPADLRAVGRFQPAAQTR